MKKVLVLVLVAALAAPAMAGAGDGTPFGANTHSIAFANGCGACHMAHTGTNDLGAPLWGLNLPTGGTTFTPYDGGDGQLAGTSSVMCMGCHDGATGQTEPDPLGGDDIDIDSTGTLTTDLSSMHPVNITYTYVDGAANGLASTSPYTLDGDGKVQCTTCHEIHQNDGQDEYALRDAPSVLCANCHSGK